MVDETIFVNSDNEVELILIDPTDLSDVDNYPKGKPYDFVANGVTKMELFVNGQSFSSDDGLVSYADSGVIKIKIGNDSSTLPHDIKYSSSVKVYDATHPNGQFMVDRSFKNSNLALTIVDPSTY